MTLMLNKAGIVTGAASGIGRAAAVAYAREGASVVVSDLESSRTAAEETVEQIRMLGGMAAFVPADVTRAADVSSLVDQCDRLYGRLDFAFNNAGILGPIGFTADVDETEFDRLMAIDIKGVWLCMKYELEYMKNHGGGAIVNTSSEAGLVGTPLAGAYVAAKHAVIGLTRTAASEYAMMNIRINAVAPGTIATPMVLSLPDEAQKVLVAPQPLNRLGAPEEVAEAVVWLSCDRASFVTGIVMPVDGGATANAQSYDPNLTPST